jgi:hypothetical protein
MGAFMKLNVMTNPARLAYFILLFVTLLFFYHSTVSKTFEGDTAHWHIEIKPTSLFEGGQVTYEYKGTLSQLNKYRHIELTYNKALRSGHQIIDIKSKNGLTETGFTIVTRRLFSSFTKNIEPSATVVFGKNKETTELARK